MTLTVHGATQSRRSCDDDDDDDPRRDCLDKLGQASDVDVWT